MNAVILAFAVLGLVGALTTDIRWMQLYLLMLTLLFVWELIYILVTAIGTRTLHSHFCSLPRVSHSLTDRVLSCAAVTCQATSGVLTR